MTRSNKGRKARRGATPSARTEVLVDENLRNALTKLLSKRNYEGLAAFCEMLIRLRAEFEPATVTMTSTNIPDAVIKLSYAIEETNKASCRVFELIERQKRLLCENDSLVAQIIAERTQDVGASALLGRYRSNHQEIAAIGHEITLAHEFQDLCGQNINKVMKLLSTLDSDIREMFRRLGCVIAPYDPNLETGDSVSQSETDDILRDLGL